GLPVADGVRAHLARGGLLLDARAGERVRGEVEPIDTRAGHVPGAVSRPYALNLDGGGFKPAAVLAAEFAALPGGGDPAKTVVMCGSGVTACHHLLAMAHAGLDGAGLYTGSWSGWIEDPLRPAAIGADGARAAALAWAICPAAPPGPAARPGCRARSMRPRRCRCRSAPAPARPAGRRGRWRASAAPAGAAGTTA